MVKSVRSSYWYNSAVMFAAGLLASFAAFALVVDALIIARTPTKILGCDINGNISCSSVARSWQSNLIHMWGTSIPNALFGLLCMGIFVGFTAALMFGYHPNAFVSWIFRIGIIVCVLFAVYLLGVSVFWLKVLCPWCLTFDAAVILLVIGYIRWLQTNDGKRHHISASLVSLGIELIPFLLLGLLVVLNY